MKVPLSVIYTGGVSLGLASAASLDYDFSGRGTAEAVTDLWARVLRLDAGSLPFALVMADTCGGGVRPGDSESTLCFEVAPSGDPTKPVTVYGTSGPDLAYGAAWYLREHCGMSFSWERAGGNQVAAPAGGWPVVATTDQGRVQWRRRDVSYGFNVCTFSYSQVWYRFGTASEGYLASWENMLDWMTISGINLALAYTGQEEVYRKV